jgi:hypothetical protein
MRMPGIAAAPVFAVGAGVAAAADPPPSPPCGNATPFPPYAEAAEARPQTWGGLDWNAPECLEWPGGKYRFVIAIAARIEARSEATLLARLGAVSTTRGMLYWSVTEGAWRVLIRDSSALSGVEGERRADFTPAEMHTGAVLRFVEEDNRSSAPVTYTMRVLQSGPARIVVETENATPIKAALITFFPAGTLRTAYILTRLGASSWGFYGLSAATNGSSRLVSLARDSYVNRAQALFGHFAGLQPANGEPPER